MKEEESGEEVTPPPAPSDFSEAAHQEFLKFRKEAFASLMRHMGNVSQWHVDLDGTRIWHEVPTEGFGIQEKGPVVLRIYFDPSFASLYVQAAEYPIRRGLKRIQGVNVKTFLANRNDTQVPRVSLCDEGRKGRYFRVSLRLRDPCKAQPDRLTLSVIGMCNAVATEAIFLREYLG